jgi:hypothetical protein
VLVQRERACALLLPAASSQQRRSRQLAHHYQPPKLVFLNTTSAQWKQRDSWLAVVSCVLACARVWLCEAMRR